MSEPRTPPAILDTVADYYSEKLRRFGATPRGVDWNSLESQALRFRQLLKVIDCNDRISLIDFGAGYGALLDHLESTELDAAYCGFDISTTMIDAARSRHEGKADCSFTSDPGSLTPADYTVASGIFNVKLGHAVEDWQAYVADTLGTMAALSLRGFAFNMLSTYSDPDKRRPDLYYADPMRMFDMCKQRFSTRVALLHDYPLYEFTMIVRM